MVASTAVGSTSTQSTNALSNAFDIKEQKDMFLKLLVAQLKNQDPTSPMDQKEMMGQMAQFTSVEQLTNMSKALETMSFNATFSQSVSLIGKTVDYVDAEGAYVTGGSVTGVSAAGGQVKLVLGDGTTIQPADVIRVS